jgi:hypothetical protein
MNDLKPTDMCTIIRGPQHRFEPTDSYLIGRTVVLLRVCTCPYCEEPHWDVTGDLTLRESDLRKIYPDPLADFQNERVDELIQDVERLRNARRERA